MRLSVSRTVLYARLKEKHSLSTPASIELTKCMYYVRAQVYSTRICFILHVGMHTRTYSESKLRKGLIAKCSAQSRVIRQIRRATRKTQGFFFCETINRLNFVRNSFAGSSRRQRERTA